jgi:hypothetical protein
LNRFVGVVWRSRADIGDTAVLFDLPKHVISAQTVTAIERMKEADIHPQ